MPCILLYWLDFFFQPNPVYTYGFQVADDQEQVYIAKEENRNGGDVQGSYSYVDANGALVTVTYTADDVNGYQETRQVQENFIQLRSKPAAPQVQVQPVVVPAPAPVVQTVQTGGDSSDLVARIISQLTPFIRDTVSTSLSSQQGQGQAITTTQAVTAPAPAPAPAAASSIESRFGSGGPSNIRVETPQYQFLTNL